MYRRLSSILAASSPASPADDGAGGESTASTSTSASIRRSYKKRSMSFFSGVDISALSDTANTRMVHRLKGAERNSTCASSSISPPSRTTQ